jgi:hypothetical protein
MGFQDLVMKAFFAMALTAALTAAPVHADCPYPAAPEKLPDGSSATLEEMVAGQKAVTKGGDQLKPQQKADMQKVEAQKHNAAIDQLQSIADRFNEQVKVFKARTDKKS